MFTMAIMFSCAWKKEEKVCMPHCNVVIRISWLIAAELIAAAADLPGVGWGNHQDGSKMVKL